MQGVYRYWKAFRWKTNRNQGEVPNQDAIQHCHFRVEGFLLDGIWEFQPLGECWVRLQLEELG